MPLLTSKKVPDVEMIATFRCGKLTRSTSEGCQRRIIATGLSIVNCSLKLHQLEDGERDTIGRSR
jgi:hypothetical protein